MKEYDIENFICENQDFFIKQLKQIYGNHDIKFIGRQVFVGNRNRLDLLYYYDDRTKEGDNWYILRNFIIIELKKNAATSKDICQLSRYINDLSSKVYTEKYLNGVDEFNVYGLIVSNGMDDDVKELECSNLLNYISFMKYSYVFSFSPISYSTNKEYIEQMQLDERIDNLWKKK